MRNKKVCVFVTAITAIAAAISGAVFFIKRHKSKSRFFACALAAVFVFSMMGVSAMAYPKDFPEDEENREEYTECMEYMAYMEIEENAIYTGDSEYTQDDNTLYAGIDNVIPALPLDPAPDDEDTQELEPTDPPQTLTPPGNMNLVDDFSGDSAVDMQFITVVTRNGHFFYIVIDRGAERQNVHFLNQVDEYSLWTILAEEEITRPIPVPTPAPIYTVPDEVPPTEADPTPTTPTESDDEQNGGIGGLLLMLLLLGAGGGGACYYFKVRKPQPSAKGADIEEMDEFVFDDDEEDMPDFTAADIEPESEDE